MTDPFHRWLFGALLCFMFFGQSVAGARYGDVVLLALVIWPVLGALCASNASRHYRAIRQQRQGS